MSVLHSLTSTEKHSSQDPRHIAIIPDGNRRWARKHGFPVLKGHDEGIRNLERLLNWVEETDIEYISLWGFSTENFNRDPQEVFGLFKLFSEWLSRLLDETDRYRDRYRIRFLGRIDKFPQILRDRMKRVEATYHTGKRQVNLLLGYGGRDEILYAVNRILEDVRSGRLKNKRITERIFERYLYTSGIPDPDLIIRTSGEMRLSGLMPWQSVYSEFYVTRKLWPEFSKRDFKRALESYRKRVRRFGR